MSIIELILSLAAILGAAVIFTNAVEENLGPRRSCWRDDGSANCSPKGTRG